MFEFFIALFGGLFYGGKMVQESNNNRAHDRHMSTWKYWTDLIEDNDYSATHELMDKLQNPEECEILLNSIKDDLVFIFGESWMYNIPQYNRSTNISDVRMSPWALVFKILLSKDGRLGFNDSHYSLWGCVSQLQIQQIIKTCIVIEKNMKQYYPELEILFYPLMAFGGGFSQSLTNGELMWSFAIQERDMYKARSLQHVLKYGKYI